MSETHSDRPNVIVIMTDDQGPWAMGCAGNSELRTPNLDRLARTGIRFDNLFCTSPVSSPARASFLTGRMPSQHGVMDWISSGSNVSEGRLIEYLEGQSGYTDILANNGYTCGISGKWHLGDSHHAQKSLSFWEVHAGGGGQYYNPPMIVDGERTGVPGYVTDIITDNALRFLDEQQGDAMPFCLSVHYTAPHAPWGRDNHPKDLWDDYYDNCPFESVPELPEHPWSNGGKMFSDPESRRATLSGYFASITAMDAGVGRILDRLEADGLREQTLVFFTGDNGMNMGHHGLYGKGNASFPQNMYEESVKVPALVSRPGYVPEGVIESGIWSHYDFRPTLLDYLGIEDTETTPLPGVSFAAVLKGEKAPQREDIVVCEEYGPVRMVRTQDWKYIHRYPYGPHELYDLAGDPGETLNLVNSPEYAGQVAEMRERLDNWFARYVRPELDGRVEPVTGKGQYELAGLAGTGRPAFAPHPRQRKVLTAEKLPEPESADE